MIVKFRHFSLYIDGKFSLIFADFSFPWHHLIRDVSEKICLGRIDYLSSLPFSPSDACMGFLRASSMSTGYDHE